MVGLKKRMTARIDKLVAIVDKVDELPEEVQGAINDVLDEMQRGQVPSWKQFFYKNGEFSKTATFHTVSWAMVLGLYFVQELFKGAIVSIGGWQWTVGAFDATAAAAILAIASGTYLGNNVLKKGEPTE